MTPTLRVGWGYRTLAAVLVGLAGLAAVAVVLTAHRIAHLEADSRSRAAAADAVPAVAAALRSAIDEAEVAARGARPAVALDELQDSGIPAELAVRARDTGQAFLDESGTVVAATYDEPLLPPSVAARRAAVTGLVVVPLELDSTVVRLRPTSGGIAVSGPSRVVAQRPGPAPADASSYTVELSSALAPGWTVTVWTPNAAVPATAWLLAAALLMAGIGAAGLLLHRASQANRARIELAGLRTRTETLGELAGVAQRSLDLADVLPAATELLREALSLRGLSLTSPSAHGERTFFVSGEQPPPSAPPLTGPVLAGQAASLLLVRAGRTVARLNVLPGRPLDTDDVVTLAASAEMLTSALANAEAFAQQRELLQRMRSLDELKTVFLATASHELRTPVGILTGFARLLSTRTDELTPDQVRTYADRIESNAQQLSTLVENLLDFSRLERGVGVDGEHGVLDLGECVNRILDRQPDLAAHHVVVRQTTPGILVRGAEHAVERVLTNLVGNAGKYSPAGTTIRVRVRELDGRAQLVVDDEGPGVAAEDREQIFSRFFRGRGDEVVNTRGAGLGLAIVREFAAVMDGVVSVAVAPTGGARFAVSYPVAEPESSPEGESDVAS